MTELRKHAGLVHKFMLAMDEAGLTPQRINELAEKKHLLREIYGWTEGWMELRPKEFVVDCNVAPELYHEENFPLEMHRRHGIVKVRRSGEEVFVDGRKICFFLLPEHKDGRKISEETVKEALPGKILLNGNLLAFFHSHQQIIPESWFWLNNPKRENPDMHRPASIYFWNTQYRCTSGNEIAVAELVGQSLGQGRYYWKSDFSRMNHLTGAVAYLE